MTLRYSPLENLVRSDKRTTKGSSLVRRLVLARDDPAKERIRQWLSAIDDDRLMSFGLTPLDIVILRSAPARQLNSHEGENIAAPVPELQRADGDAPN